MQSYSLQNDAVTDAKFETLICKAQCETIRASIGRIIMNTASACKVWTRNEMFAVQRLGRKWSFDFQQLRDESTAIYRTAMRV